MCCLVHRMVCPAPCPHQNNPRPWPRPRLGVVWQDAKTKTVYGTFLANDLQSQRTIVLLAGPNKGEAGVRCEASWLGLGGRCNPKPKPHPHTKPSA